MLHLDCLATHVSRNLILKKPKNSNCYALDVWHAYDEGLQCNGPTVGTVLSATIHYLLATAGFIALSRIGASCERYGEHETLTLPLSPFLNPKARAGFIPFGASCERYGEHETLTLPPSFFSTLKLGRIHSPFVYISDP